MRGLLDFMFPPRCVACDRPGRILCDVCCKRVVGIDPLEACPRCGAPIPQAQAWCVECRGTRYAFSSARCAALLEPPVSTAVLMLKDGGERRCAAELARLLAPCLDGWLRDGDMLVPVPATPAALRRRGFDHASDIAHALGSLTGTQVAHLVEAKRGADQRALNRSSRFANREGAFEVREARGRRIPRSVVVLDDVFTTGATLDGVARVLRCAGVEDVRAAAVARAL